MKVKDEVKTKAQLLDELAATRQRMAQMQQRIIELEALHTERQRLEAAYCSMQEHKARTQSDAAECFQFPEHPQLREIFAFIEANYYQSISLNEVAKAFDYSPSYLTSLVRRLTGQTVYQWIVQRRMFQARRLLLDTHQTVHEVAEAVGYVDVGHFVKHFRQLHSLPPKTWKEAQFQR
jgi:AraC-like DNA-binding protein